MRKSKLLILLLLLLVIGKAYAADVFVDNTASCSTDDGTSDHPWCSIQAALDNAAAGQDIKIRTGTGVYSQNAFISGKNGTSINPIILEPDTGANFRITSSGAANNTGAIEIKESDYWTIRNLTFDANDNTNVSQYLLFAQCETKDCVGWNISGNTFQNLRQVTDSGYGKIGVNFVGCHVDFGCGANRMMTGIIENNNFNNIDGIGLHLSVVLNSTIRNNTFSAIRCGKNVPGNENIAAGIHHDFGNYGNSIYNNTIHDFIAFASCPHTLTGGYPVTAGIWYDACRGSANEYVYNNTIYNLDQSKRNYDNGHFSVGIFYESQCKKGYIYNNLIYGIGNEGIVHSFHSQGVSGDMSYYYHNTIYDTMHGFNIKEGYATFENNIISKVTDAVMCVACNADWGYAVLTADYNLYDDGASQTKIGQWNGTVYNFANWKTNCSCDANSKNASPKFVGPLPG
ncbi:MAG TPA: hypothetical protein VIY48_07350 [Candidatus Paceibacterota bacterium]